MSNRATHLNVSAFTLGANDYLGLFRSATISDEVETPDGTAVSQRWGIVVPAKRRRTITLEELITDSNLRQTGLDVSVWTVGSTALVGRLRSGTVGITTQTEDGSGVSDQWEFPVPTGTTFELSSELLVTTNPAVMELIRNTGISQLLVNVVVNVGGGVSATFPCTISRGELRLQQGQIQIENIVFANRGQPTAVGSHPIFASILTGTAAFTYSATTASSVTTSGDCIVTQTNISFGNGQISTASHTLAGQGAPSA